MPICYPIQDNEAAYTTGQLRQIGTRKQRIG